MSFKYADYTVAWICALPLEAAAAKAMLDKLHTPPQQIPDPNAYEFGELNGHHIVIAYLPNGVYGTVSAATVVSRLRLTFPRLQFGLMVGIGGGVPSQSNDIRLGDVVVSKPGGNHGGVIQYDYGKAALLTHMSRLQAMQLTGGEGAISKLVGDALMRNPTMNERFSPPEQNTDYLFNSSYHHVDKDSDCGKCDKEHLVERQPRTINTGYIHYGLIASGDQVMKDSDTRDRLAQQHGILCFEMEAAGLMNELPTLVIRGICDYCDSHKQKNWQGFAALTAAAYAKLLLSGIPANSSSPDSKNTRHWMVSLPRNLKFVGRQDEIAKLEELLAMQDGPGKIAITGLGGVGKTQVALELAYRIRDQDTGCSIFWVACTSHAMVEQSFLKIAQILGLCDVKPGEVKEQVQTYLSSEYAGKWLLIFDNADDTEMWLAAHDRAPALEAFLPQSEQGRILFTTRNWELAVDLTYSNIIPIPDVDKETARNVLESLLLQKYLPDDSNINALLEQLAFLPLAIAQAAAYINKKRLDLATYLKLLQEEQAAVELLSEKFRDPGRYKDIENAVITTWLISFKQIQHQDPLAADYLSFMACLNPRNVPQSILPLQTSEKKRLDALGLLNAYSFTNSQELYISMHRLVHIATRNWLRKNGMFDHWIQRVADRLEKVFPDHGHANRGLWRDYLPHALALMDEDEFVKEREKYINLLKNAADCLASDGRFLESEALYKSLLKINQDKHGQEHPSTLTSMYNLTSTYWRQGRWDEAEKLGSQVMETRKAVLGDKHPDTLASIASLAVIYLNQGRWDNAEELQVQVVETIKIVLGDKNPSTLTSMANLASTYRNQGRLGEAEELEVQVVEMGKTVLGDKHPSTLASMVNLAGTYARQGRWDKAEELQIQVVETIKIVLGEKHPDTLTSISNLAATYRSQGRLDKAEELDVQVMKTRKVVLGDKHPNTLGRLDEAEELGIQVMESMKIVLGNKHPDTLTSMASLSAIYRSQGQWDDAEKLQVQVVETSKEILGDRHPDTLTSIADLAATYLYQGRWDDAEELQVQVVESRKAVLGDKHPSTLASIGRWDKAEELQIQVVETMKAVLGDKHPNTLASMASLSATYRRQGRLDKAEELEVQVMKTRKLALPTWLQPTGVRDDGMMPRSYKSKWWRQARKS
ncbi:hypothetical protein BJX63DRAFT_445310 [Aspergillus granulosus]|uniref:Uncharacterized protein n=1 Tax=Aspergillus granulosus TaxID=176169 RepID=A0ABR4HW47_9EURO